MRKRKQFMQPWKAFKKIILSISPILLISLFTAKKVALTLPGKSKNWVFPCLLSFDLK